jgi:uncharacterized protein (TIGR02466 family)
MITELFPLKIYQTTYSKVDEIKHSLFPKLEHLWEPSLADNQQFMRDGTICSYHTSANIHKDFPTETRDIVLFANKCAKEYWKELDYYDGLEPFVAQVWSNKTPKGGWIHSHIHLSIPLTAILYVDASPEQGNIIFENPNDMLLAAQPINYRKKIQFEHEMEVNTGDFVIFPAFLRHKVLPNNTDRDRLILGFNYASKGEYWSAQWVDNNPTLR